MPTWLADVLLGIPVALGALAPHPSTAEPSAPALGASLLVGLVVAASLPLARRFPRSMLAATSLLAAVAPLLSIANLAFVLAAAICLYRLASVTPDRRAVLIALLASSAAIVTGIAIAGPVDRYLAWFLQPLALLTGAAALGEAVRSRRAYIDAVTERAERAERTRELEAERRVADERLRIARELHDAAGHQMAAINLNAGVAKNALPADPDRAIELLSGIQQSARTVLSEISALLQLLRASPDEADAAPLAPVATWAELPTMLAGFRRLGLDIRGELPETVPGLAGATDVVAYRVMQEGLANALAHGDGHADVMAEASADALRLRVENLIGAGREESASRRYGLIGMRERVESVEGSVSHRREPRREGIAFVLDVRLPLLPAGALT